MRKIVFGLMIISCLLIVANAFAADGDMIVNGKIGVGTTNPISKLTVAVPDGGATLGICVNGTGEGVHLKDNANTVEYGSLKSNSTGNGSVRLTTPDANKTLILQQNGGNVGIGTTTPAYTLEVNGTIRASSGIAVYQITNSICNNVGALTLSTNCSTVKCGECCGDSPDPRYFSCNGSFCNDSSPQSCNLNTLVGRLITP